MNQELASDAVGKYIDSVSNQEVRLGYRFDECEKDFTKRFFNDKKTPIKADESFLHYFFPTGGFHGEFCLALACI